MKYVFTLSYLIGCSRHDFVNYWEDASKFPTIASISPNTLDSFRGGEEITITGTLLEDTKTVLIGDRNASIISISETEVVVRAPQLLAGSQWAELTIITNDGYARTSEAIEYNHFGVEYWQQEIASVNITRLDCPIEAYTVSDGEYYPIFWCGLEMGYSTASALIGTHPQPGFAGDNGSFTPLSAIGELGVATYITEPSLATPYRYGPYLSGDSLSIQTKRNTQKDMNQITRLINWFSDNYYWSADVTNIDPLLVLVDAEYCFLLESTDFSVTDTGFDLGENTTGAAGFWLGYQAIEDYNGEPYIYEGFAVTGTVDANGNVVEASPSGSVLEYSDYSGYFDGYGPDIALGSRDFPNNQDYTVELHHKGETQSLGQFTVGREFALSWPALLSGQEQIIRSNGYAFEWEPQQSDNPSIVVAEYTIYDFDVSDPNGWYTIGTLVKAVEDSDGYLEFTPEELADLPLVGNNSDTDLNSFGIWGEMTISRHTLYSIDYPTTQYDNGQLIIDMVHAIQSPVDLVE